jgi:serine/threonine protein phosphatase PrpC
MTAIGGRLTNQDAIACAFEDGLSCFVVADGTGGHEGGEIAANLVTNSVIEKFKQEASFSTRALHSYVAWANNQVTKTQEQDAKLRNMSTTIATVLIDHDNCSALWAHLGDTRIYLFRDGRIINISKDHSLAQRLVDAGAADYSTIRLHPQRSVLFAAIGAQGDADLEISQVPMALQDGDAFILCSDGFWEWVQDHEMEQSLTNTQSSAEWLSKMTTIAEYNIADKSISRDNFSVFAIRIHASVEA